MTETIMVYPFTCVSLPQVTGLDLAFPEYKKAVLVSPRGIARKGWDASFLDGRKTLGLPVRNDSETALEECDTLLITEGKEGDTPHVQSLSLIRQALAEGKEVFCTLELEEETLAELQDGVNAVRFHYSAADNREAAEKTRQERRGMLFDWEGIPVVGVGSMLEEANPFEVLLNLHRELTERGRKVTSLAYKKYAGLYGCHPYPAAFFDKHASTEEKAEQLKRYLRILIGREHPDIILVQYPGTMVQLNEQLPQDYGVDVYLAAQLIRADHLVFCVPFQYYEPGLMGPMSGDFSAKFGFPIDSCHMSSCTVNLDSSFERQKIITYHLGEDAVEQEVRWWEGQDIPLYDLLDRNQVKAACDAICADVLGERLIASGV